MTDHTIQSGKRDELMLGQPYPHPPIQEALVELRFSEDDGWNWTWPGRFWALVKDEYDGEPRSEQAISVNAHQQARTMTTRAVSGVGRVLLTRTADSGLVALSPLAMSVHILKPYLGWAVFRPRVVSAIEAHQKISPNARVTRIGVRYMNRIVIQGETLDLSDWFTSSPTVPQQVGPSLAGLMSRVETVYDDGARLAITLANVPHDVAKEHAFFLDLDLWSNPTEPMLLSEEVFKVIELLHDRESKAFEAMITNKTRELFR
jgi:uncharacterized protein (TIGR04255 family)